MSAPTISPDAAILEAFEKVRAHRAYVYSFDNVPQGQVDEATEEAIAAKDAEMLAHEAIVQGTSATTIAGVVARLQLVIPSIDQGRWVDRTIMQHGLLSLREHRDGMEPGAAQVTSAALDLLRLDWQQAVDAYEQSSADFKAILDIKAIAEREQFAHRRAGHPSEFAEGIATAIEEFANRLMNRDCRNLERLIQTPVPDWQAYRRKAEIAIKECLAAEASTWLLQDANTLLAAQDGEA